jgi:hypothetical protein
VGNIRIELEKIGQRLSEQGKGPIACASEHDNEPSGS